MPVKRGAPHEIGLDACAGTPADVCPGVAGTLLGVGRWRRHRRSEPTSASPVTSGYATARKHSGIRYNHRYVTEATAVYTDLTLSAAAKSALQAATHRAVETIGPQNYPGNH